MKTKNYEVDGHTYTNPSCVKFCEDMEKAELEVEHYEGRYWWTGPSVTVGAIQDALSYTKVPCQWDNMGRQFVVYPRASDKGTA